MSKTIEVNRESVTGPLLLLAGDVEEVGVFDSLDAVERGAEAYTARVFAGREIADIIAKTRPDWLWLTNETGVLYGYYRSTVAVFMRRGWPLPDPLFYAQRI